MRQLTVTDAKREAAKGKIALSGGPGFGKTWTALRIARVLSPEGTVMVIDTEHESARLYAPPFVFKHTAWEPPYDAKELAQAIQHYAPHVDVLIVDSLSHFWIGEGGVLELAGGKFTGWKEARPVQRALVEAIVRAPCHVVGCMRSKVEYSQEYSEKEKRQVVTRLGTADMQSDDMPYEFTVAAELDLQHRLTITKTRCADLDGKIYRPNHEVDMAQVLLAWLQGGAQPAADGEVRPDPSTPAGMRAAQEEATAVRNGGQQQPAPAGEPATAEGEDAPITLQHLLDTFAINRNQLCLFLRKEAREDFGKLTVPDLDQLTPEQLHRAAAYLGANREAVG
jgi:hypothetical protein